MRMIKLPIHVREEKDYPEFDLDDFVQNVKKGKISPDHCIILKPAGHSRVEYLYPKDHLTSFDIACIVRENPELRKHFDPNKLSENDWTYIAFSHPNLRETWINDIS